MPPLAGKQDSRLKEMMTGIILLDSLVRVAQLVIHCYDNGTKYSYDEVTLTPDAM